MKCFWQCFVAIFIFFYTITVTRASENLFYILRGYNKPTPEQFAQFSYLDKHADLIDILVMQAFQVNSDGSIWGDVNPVINNFATEHHIKVMPLITNQDIGNSFTAHKFLTNPIAVDRAIKAIVDRCKQEHYYGVQIDFEGISIRDRDKLTQFYQKITQALHQIGLIVSVAIFPYTTNNPEQSAFLKRIYEDWAGAYDLKAINNIFDFVSIMTYEQHQEGTTPGPNASFTWVKEAIQYTLQYVDPKKISLGIPDYSYYWHTAAIDHQKPIAMTLNYLSYHELKSFLKKNHLHLHWDSMQKVNWAVFQRNALYEYIFAEDAQAFAAKLKLVDHYHLRGISFFRIGFEDPKIWDILNENKNRIRSSTYIKCLFIKSMYGLALFPCN